MKDKLAIFDLDGTLFNTEDVNYFAYKKALEKYGYDIEKEYFTKKCNGRHYTEFLPKIVENESIIDNIHILKKEFYHSYLDKALLNEHLFQIIKLIKEEYYIAIVTTASRRNCEEILEHFMVKNLFDKIITQEDVEKVKPNPEGFIRAMNFFNIQPKSTIIYEDSQVGIEAAIKSEASVVAVKKF